MIRFQDELKKIKSMDRREATDYIIMYYLPVSIGIVVLLCLLLSTLSQAVKNQQLTPVIKVGVVSDLDMFCGNRIDDMLTRAFADAAGKQAPQKRTFTSPDESENMFSSMEISSYIAAGDVDVVLGDQNTADLLSEAGDLVSITEISDTPLGVLAGKIGVSRLYFICFPERGGAEKADYLLWFIQNDTLL